MKFSLSLLFGLLLLATSCDSQKTNASSAATATTNAAPERGAMTAGNPEPVAGFTIDDLDKKYEGFEKAYFAGGCFWCTEASFDRIQGVEDVYSGYAGGTEVNPTYKEVSYGKTSHAEAIVVYYDPAIIDYNTLLDVFFVAHDPTTLNRQGPDRGPHYRSAIFPINAEQEKLAKAKIKKLDASGKFSAPIVTTIEKAEPFYVAEGYHQDYYEDSSNPNWSYVTNVSKPKVEKVLRTFRERVKVEYLGEIE